MPRNKSPLPKRPPAPQRAAKRVIVSSRSASASAAMPPAKVARLAAETSPPRTARADADGGGKARPARRTKVAAVAKPPRLVFNAAVHPGKLAESHAKAEKVFKSFTLSRFGRKGGPDHYKAPDEHVTVAQRRTITAHLKKQSAAAKKDDAPQRAMTLALPPDMLKELLPSHSRNKVDLDEVVNVLTKYMRGRELVANGDPTLNRLALQSKINKIFASITSAQTTQSTKKRAKK
jgi:hypothetical protein